MKRLFSAILIIVIISQYFIYPIYAQASIKSSAVEFAGCATGNIAGNYLSGKVAGLVSKLKDKIKDKVTSGITDALTTVPVSDSGVKGAQKDGNAQDFTKAYVTDVIARCAARTILNTMVANIFDIMRTSGRDGGVTFIRNWTNFQLAAQYRGENIFRAELSTAQLCDYLADGIKKSFGVDPNKKTPISGQSTRTDSLQPFSVSSKCTMPAGFSMSKYQNDFAGNGGWDAFSRMLEPQNNAWGLTAMSQTEITKQRGLAVSADLAQAQAGSGYIGTSGRGKADSCAVKSPNGNDCIVYNDIKTTGSYIAANVAASINAELTWITSAQSLGSIVANLTEVLLNRMLDQGNPDEGLPRSADETGGIDLSTAGPTATTTPTGTPQVCLLTATKTRLTPLSIQIKSAINSIDLGTRENTIKSRMDPAIILIHNLRVSLSTTEYDTASKLQDIESIMGSFESLALTNNKTAPETNQLNDYRRAITKDLDDLLAEPICTTATPTPTSEPDLSCAEQGLKEAYSQNVVSAISDFMLAQPAIASLPDDDEGGPNNTLFMNGVVNTLSGKGFTSGRLLHVATGKLSGDKIIVGKNPPDPDGEVYDIINSTGDGKPFNSNGKISNSCKIHEDWSKLVPAEPAP
ncbi:MAG: hypothetical protein KBC81_02035 [Candidatus Pacebacteria bacterium]|nr:hypothetical protein [Candidatus Paceibacterota bacterium]